MKYIKSKKYSSAEIMRKIMGPNPIKLTEELLNNNMIRRKAKVCDLGSGQGLTSVFMAKEYGYKVVAADLWSNQEENTEFFKQQGLTEAQIIPVKADAQNGLPFQKGWIAQDNEYAVNDRKSITAGATKYLNFIKIVLQKL